LRPAITRLVNFQYHQPLSRHWGNSTLSSSDGQRFPVALSNRKARALPRYFGYGKGLTFYTWTSDQHSQYGSKPTITTDRDALYILDEILNNETELPLLEHAADTAGFTDIIFGLFSLLGLQFSPTYPGYWRTTFVPNGTFAQSPGTPAHYQTLTQTEIDCGALGRLTPHSSLSQIWLGNGFAAN